MTFQDDILKAIVERFRDNTLGLDITWDRIEPYAIDDNCRKKAAALGIVDQGQKFNFKVSMNDMTWRLAIEFFVRCNSTEDIQSKVNLARSVVFRTMMADPNLGNMVEDTTPVVDEVFMERAENYGEGVMLFDIRYRTRPDDLATALT